MAIRAIAYVVFSRIHSDIFQLICLKNWQEEPWVIAIHTKMTLFANAAQNWYQAVAGFVASAITIKTDLVQAGMVALSAGQNLRIILDENLVFAKT